MIAVKSKKFPATNTYIHILRWKNNSLGEHLQSNARIHAPEQKKQSYCESHSYIPAAYFTIWKVVNFQCI